MSNLISSFQASSRLGISIWTLYAWARAGKITYVKLGKKILFDPDDVDQFIEQRKITCKGGYKNA